MSGPLGSGLVLAVPVSDLSATYDLWRSEGLTVTLEPQDAYWARIFYGLDPDGYELMFEEHLRTPKVSTEQPDLYRAARPSATSTPRGCARR